MGGIKRFFELSVAVLMTAVLLCVCGCGSSYDEGLMPDNTADTETSETPDTEGEAVAVIPKGGVAKLSIGPYDTLNPLITENEDVCVYTSLIYEKLVRLDSLAEPLPAVLASWVCGADYKVWEFSVREGVNFHNGDTVSAEDVKALIDCIKEKGGNYGENVKNIAGCFVKDEMTVQFILNEPDAFLPAKLSIPLLSKDTLSGGNADSKPVGAGMYRFVSKEGDVIRLERFEDYYDGERKPNIDGVEINVYKSEYEKYGSDFDLAFFYGSKKASYVFDSETRAVEFLGKSCSYVAINCEPTYTFETVDETDGKTVVYNAIDNAFYDSRVRQAISLLIDRSMICDIAAAGKGKTVMFPAYSGTPLWNNKYADGGVDTETAYKLLKEAGYSKSDTDGLWYYQDGTLLIAEAVSPNDDFELRSVMRGVKQCLEAEGITVNLQELSDEAFDEKFDKKQYMLVPVKLELGSWTDIEKIYASYGEYNYSFYSNSTVDGYFRQLKTLGEKDVVSAGYNAIEDILIKDCPVTALYINYDSALVRSGLLGVTRTSFYAWDPLADFYKWGIAEASQETVPKEE